MMRNSLVAAGFGAMVALGLIGYGCTSSDTVGGTGGSTGSGGHGTGGTTGGGVGGTTGAGVGGTTGGGTGGTTGGGTGGTTGGGVGGTTGGGVGGTTGTLPMCVPAPSDKSTCDAATAISPCTKNCGINAAGITQPRAQKPCACIASTVMPPTAWDCTNSGPCVYPTTFDSTCFKLTPTAPPACPTTLITAGVTTCTNTTGATCGPLCGAATGNSYQTGTTTFTPKVGYCACINGIWQCASVNEWPM
jgi:hypothetical protein